MKNTGVVRKIDELGRIVIPKEIRKNLSIKNDEEVQIYVEDNMIILKKYERITSCLDRINVLVNVFDKFVSSLYISDKEKIIVSSNGKFINESIDNNIMLSMEERKSLDGYMINIGSTSLNEYYYMLPIIVDASVVGSVILVNKNKINDEDKLVLSILKCLIQLEMC